MAIQIPGITTRVDGYNDVGISGAKNAALPILLSALLVRGVTVIRNAPSSAADTLAVLGLIRSFGLDVRLEGSDIILTNTGLAPSETIGRHCSTRYSVLLLPILLRLNGRIQLPQPGGCDLGDRPLTIHLAGLSAFGAECDSDDNSITASLISQGQESFTLSYPSVTATECLILFSVLGPEVRYTTAHVSQRLKI